jgi:hypothetical protein
VTATLVAAWPEQLVTGLAALGGAALGAGAVVWTGVHGERRQEERERRSALVDLYAATNAFGYAWSAWAEIHVEGPLANLRTGARLGGVGGAAFAGRIWTVTDAFWHASGRLRAVAGADELAALDAIEDVIGMWRFGEPMPESFGHAIRQVRALLEKRGDSLPTPPSP